MKQQHVTYIDKDEVFGVIVGMSRSDYITTKACILDTLNIEDNKENRKVLTVVIKQLKEDKRIYTTYAINEDDPGYRGRGYMTDLVRTMHAIGDTVVLLDTPCEVVERSVTCLSNPCERCFLYKRSGCHAVACYADERIDDTNVYFREVQDGK